MVTAKQLTHGPFDGDTEVPGSGVQEVAVYLSRITDLPFREAIHWKRLVATVLGDNAGTLPSEPSPPPGTDTRSRGDRDRGIDSHLHALILPVDGREKPVRVYFGNEFCELRIPKRGEFEASCAAVHEAGLPLTFVTPPATDKGMETLFDRLTDLQRWSPQSEVVVNDWGTLRLLNEEFTPLTPLLGRLMSKLLRDPRITPRCNDPGVSPEALDSLRKCSLNISTYRSLLMSYGVGRIELDNVYQGIDMDFGAMGLRPSIYIPYGYVTTGRICLPGNVHLPRNRKFGTESGPCPLPCLRVEIDLADRNAKADGGMHAYTQRGNTIFYRQSEQLVSQGLSWAEQQGARLVYQPEIPF